MAALQSISICSAKFRSARTSRISICPFTGKQPAKFQFVVESKQYSLIAGAISCDFCHPLTWGFAPPATPALATPSQVVRGSGHSLFHTEGSAADAAAPWALLLWRPAGGRGSKFRGRSVRKLHDRLQFFRLITQTCDFWQDKSTAPVSRCGW